MVIHLLLTKHWTAAFPLNLNTMNALYVTALLAASVAFAEDPAHAFRKDPVLEKILDREYSGAQLKQLGTNSNICKHLDSEYVEAIQGKMKLAHMKLASKCILDMMKENESAFQKLTEEIHGDEKEKKKFFRIHAEMFCSNTKAFKEIDEDEWYKPLGQFCDKYYLEDSRQKLEQSRKLVEELEGKLKKPNGASSAVASSFVAVLALAATLFL